MGGWLGALLLFAKCCVNPVILATERAALDNYSLCFLLPHMVESKEITPSIFWKTLKKLKERGFTYASWGLVKVNSTVSTLRFLIR